MTQPPRVPRPLARHVAAVRRDASPAGLQKGAKDGRKHTALAVCTLIFCNLVSGILMLVDDAKRPENPPY